MRCPQWVITFIFLQDITQGSQRLKKVNVSIYYGTHIPSCEKFMKEQLKPTWDIYQKHINLTLFPYGELNYQYAKLFWNFDCMRGFKNEFESSKLQAVLAHIIRIIPKYRDNCVRILTCLMGYDNHFKSLAKCTQKKDSLLYVKILLKYTSITSSAKLAEYGDRTNGFPKPMTSFPTLIFNDVFVRQDELDSLKNFTEVIRKYIS